MKRILFFLLLVSGVAMGQGKVTIKAGRVSADNIDAGITNTPFRKVDSVKVAAGLDSTQAKRRILDSLTVIRAAIASSGGAVADSSITNAKLAKSISSKLNDVVIDVAARYGVVADGVTDNAAALMQMRSDLAGANKPHYILIFPSGTVASSNNRFDYNIVSCEFRGGASGTIFRSIYSGTNEAFQQSFFPCDMFQNNVLAYTGAATFTNGYRFNTAVAGSRTLNCTTIADAANFSAGQRIFLYGFDQAGGGFPPATRYNEWHTIESVNTATGVITLKEALENNWFSNWFDNPNQLGTGQSIGKPRILQLERSDYIYPKYRKFSNITWGLRTAGTGYTVMQPIAETVEVEGCTTEGNFWPTEVRSFRARYINAIGDPSVYTAEIDKCGGSILIEDSYFRPQIVNASCWNRVELNRVVTDESIQIASRSLSIKNCTARANGNPSNVSPFSNAPASNPMRNLEIENLTFIKGSGTSATTAIDLVPVLSYTITNVSGTNIIVPFTTGNQSSATGFYYTLDIGTTLYKDDGSKFGKVTALSFDETYNSGQGAFVVSGTWAAPVASETWKWRTVENFIDRGGHRNLGNFNPIFSNSSFMWSGVQEKSRIRTTKLNVKNLALNGSERVVPIAGQVLSMEYKPTKVYTGTDSYAILYIADNSGNSIMRINLFQPNTRQVNEFAALGAYTGGNGNGVTYNDALDYTKCGIFNTSLKFTMVGPSNAALADQSDASLPDFEITIRWIAY